MSMNNQAIADFFHNYVTSMEDKPRHTEKANIEVDVFDEFCTEVFSGNMPMQIQMFDKMMNVAVEFEESGFIAGFKTAMQMFTGISVKEGVA